MNVVILPKSEINLAVVKRMIALVQSKPNPVLGLATGSTPLGVYSLLIEAYKKGEVSFAHVTTFNLDEYVGLDGSSEQSYRFFMNKNLFDHIDIEKAKTHVPSGKGNPEESAIAYEREIEQYEGVDFQILGLGSNGHIAFNEPGSKFASKTHVVDLAKSTIQDNSRFFSSIEEVPTQAVTMGLASIMKAKEIVLIATGTKKAPAVKELIEGKQTEQMPCSILQSHPNVTIYIDEDAASLLSK